MAYYSNNKVKKFFKKPFKLKYSNSNQFKGNSSTGKNVKVESKEEKKEIKNIIEKKQLNLKGDLGYDCNYYVGKIESERWSILCRKDWGDKSSNQGIYLMAWGGDKDEGTYQI